MVPRRSRGLCWSKPRIRSLASSGGEYSASSGHSMLSVHRITWNKTYTADLLNFNSSIKNYRGQSHANGNHASEQWGIFFISWHSNKKYNCQIWYCLFQQDTHNTTRQIRNVLGKLRLTVQFYVLSAVFSTVMVQKTYSSLSTVIGDNFLPDSNWLKYV